MLSATFGSDFAGFLWTENTRIATDVRSKSEISTDLTNVNRKDSRSWFWSVAIHHRYNTDSTVSWILLSSGYTKGTNANMYVEYVSPHRWLLWCFSSDSWTPFCHLPCDEVSVCVAGTPLAPSSRILPETKSKMYEWVNFIFLNLFFQQCHQNPTALILLYLSGNAQGSKPLTAT